MPCLFVYEHILKKSVSAVKNAEFLVFLLQNMKLIIISILIFTSLTAFSQKAYEIEYYNGKTKTFSVKFTLANGYIAACEILKKDFVTQKTVKYIPEFGAESANHKMKFLRLSKSASTPADYFILDGIRDGYEVLPKEIHGIYCHHLKKYQILLFKK